MDGDFVLGEGDAVRLTLVNDAVERAGRRVRVRAEVKDLAGTVVDAEPALAQAAKEARDYIAKVEKG